MRIYAKVSLLTVAVATASSLATVFAVNTLNSDRSLAVADAVVGGAYDSGRVYTVGNGVTPPTDFTHAAESTINGVVSIKSYATPRGMQQFGGGSQFSDPLFDFFFGNPRRQQTPRQQPQQPKSEQQMGLGSGVIISHDGYIVTNNHVIDGAERLEVTLNDNTIYNATVVGTDPSTDVALLKVEAENLPVIPMGDSDALKVGEWVLAVGNPFGFTSTVTTGIVSAKARSISNGMHGSPLGIESYIQTDAAVNPGNSGGALVNINGELVGINTAIYSQTGNYVGYSFAIPTAIVTKVITDIKQYGTVQRAVLGVMFTELTPQVAKEKGITAVNDGILVGELVDRGAAMEAGIKVGDVITAINGAPTHTTAQLRGEISKYRPGDKIELEYVRDNKSHTVSVTLRNDQGDTKLAKATDFGTLGCAFKELTDELRAQYRINGGVQVSGVSDGKFKEAGVKTGFIILAINNQRVSSKADIEKMFEAITKGNSADKVMFITGIYPTGRRDYYAVDLSDAKE